MYNFGKIKLVIWDLDETFWSGTISEGNVSLIEKNISLVKKLTDIGIVNSICSKNDYESTMEFLKKNNLDYYFVFPSINWESKGGRLKEIISDMQLRPTNVLFIDDNPSNLGEAAHFSPDLMTGGPEIIENLVSDSFKCTSTDSNHKRLKQYKVLEEKRNAKKTFSSNEEFLYQSNVKVDIVYDALPELERIHDLLFRANQLNFTKNRVSIEELRETLSDKDVKAGYVSVKDNFGDYGIVGFFAVKSDALIHFTFSCRTLGMGIEQYVYNILNRPELIIVGEVVGDLSSEVIPGWINQNDYDVKKEKMSIDDAGRGSVLIKGPCDLFQIYPYISNTEFFDTEFTYVTNAGLTIESTGHTTNIVEALRLDAEQKKRVVEEVPFTDIGMYRDNIFKKNYKVVFISILADANLGVYKRKDTGEKFAFLEYIHPITDNKNWQGLIEKKYPTSGFQFTEEILKEFSEKYEFVGRNTPEQIIENLSFIRNNLPSECTLAVMLGGEIYYEKNTFEAYMDRHIVHKQINEKIRKWSSEQKKVELVDVNSYIVDQSSFYDHFNHYIKPVYYSLASDVVRIVNNALKSNIKNTSKLKMVAIRLKEILAPFYYMIFKRKNKK